jgi:hypothetical protein
MDKNQIKQMKNKTNTHAGSNATPGSKGTSPKDLVPKSADKSVTGASHHNSGKPLTTATGIKIVCFACYVENSIQSTLEVLQTVRELLSTNGKQKDIVEGLDLAEFALDGLLEEIRSKHHGEGLPKGNIPVREIPYVVTPKK